tara:strand:- start:3712 stop:4920 length:1209 start_codon:yes stop_codon:yes gene_type:complete
LQSLDWNHNVIDVFTSLEQTGDVFYLDDVTNHGWSYIILLEDPLSSDPWELMDTNESKQKKPGPMPFTGGLVGWLSYGVNKGKNWNNPKKHSSQPLFSFFDARYILCFHKDYGWWTNAISRFKDLKVEKKSKNIPNGNMYSTISFDEYASEINLIKKMIMKGEMYEANFTFKLKGEIEDSLNLYLQFREKCKTSLCCFAKSQDLIIGSGSPELFLSCSDGVYLSEPMKGTASHCDIDLTKDKKERSELAIVVDLVRNDFYKCCNFESVNVSDASLVKEYPTLKQAVARVSGVKRKDVKKWEMIKSLLPSGSISGAPRSRVIPHLDLAEKNPRGIYCGAMGWWAYGGDFKLSLPIRTFVARDKNLEYSVGSGITWRSDPEKEWQECKIKANCLNESFKGAIAW